VDRGEAGLPGVRLELLNDEGEVIASTLTNRLGLYSFTQFPETGDFQVRLVPPAGRVTTTANPRDVLISTGDANLRGVNFGLRAAGVSALTTAGDEQGDASFEDFAAIATALLASGTLEE
jgi:hypothetical protein